MKSAAKYFWCNIHYSGIPSLLNLVKLDVIDLQELHQGSHLFSYDDGICVIMYEGKIHILSEIPECTLLKPHLSQIEYEVK